MGITHIDSDHRALGGPHAEGSDQIASPAGMLEEAENQKDKDALNDDDAEPSLEGETKQHNRLSPVKIVVLTIVMTLTSFTGLAASLAVTLLVPSIARTLNVSGVQAQWVTSSYSLGYGCGRLADMYGRKKLYLLGMSIFVVAAAVTGVIRRLEPICALRAVAGIGMSIANPAGFGIIGTSVPHEPARTVVFACFGIGNALGATMGGLIGGALGQVNGKAKVNNSTGWQYVFYLLAGLGATTALAAFFAIAPDTALKDDKRNVDTRIDMFGGCLISAAICLFTYSLTDSGIAERGWAEPRVPALFGVSLILFLIWYLWSRHLESRDRAPIVPLHLFIKHRARISILCVCFWAAALNVYGFVYDHTIFYQDHLGMTTWEHVVKVLPTRAGGLIFTGAVLAVVPRVKVLYILIAASILSAIAALLHAVRPEGTNYWAIEFPSQIIMPAAYDLIGGMGSLLMSNMLDSEEQSVGGALFQTSGQVGGALGFCLSALTISEVGSKRGQLLQGLRAAFYLDMAAALLVLPLAIIGFRRVGLAKDVGK